VSESTWLPALIIGGAALAIGIVASWVLRRRSPSPIAAEESQRDQITALEDRRDQIYARLRDDTASLEPSEARRLEDEAATILRDLDTLTASLDNASPPRTRPAETGVDGKPIGMSTRRAALVGFLSGVAATLLVTFLIGSASNEAKPREVTSPMPAANAAEASRGAGAPGQPFHEEANELSAEIATRVEALRARLVTNPTDLSATKQLAFLLLINGNFVEAFDYSKKALEMNPDDPDGLYVQGVVRIRMGQVQQAIDLLDRVLKQYPDHLLALIARGSALQRVGDTAQAVETWQRALAVAGGNHPEIERMIAEAQGATTAPTIAAAATDSVTDRATDNNSGFAVRIELAPGASGPPGGTLFLSLRAAEGGPPTAARKVVNPQFPLELTLSQADSMLGGPLPTSGSLTARLDADGNAITRSAGDLAATATATAGGKRITLRLQG